ncbi:MAG: hypothetical protein R3236_00465 [Phycisphaeraceae bacterium]|nr:hypothetical protein [Phycisphaeraceae bacterium]
MSMLEGVSIRRAACVVCLLCLSAVTAAAGQDKKNGKGFDDPTKRDLKDLVRTLAKKAREVRKIGKTEPTVDSKLVFKYTQVEDKNEKVFKLLSTRLDRDPTIDAYIKRHLLYLQPDFFKAPPKTHLAVIKGLPDYLPMYQPTDSQMKIFLRYGGKPLQSNSREYKLVTAEVAKLTEIQDIVRKRNEHVVEYRQAIEQRIMSKGGLKLFAMAVNIRDRYVTDNWYDNGGKGNKRVDAMLAEAKSLWNAKKPIVMRRAIKAVLDDLAERQHGRPKYSGNRRKIVFNSGSNKLELNHWHHRPLGGNLAKHKDIMTFLGYAD